MKQTLISAGVAILLVGGFYLAKSYYLKSNVKQGAAAKEIISELPDGSDFKLSDLKGEFVLLDFWGSWCGPCRESHPELVRLYTQHQGKGKPGFEIVSFGVEKNKENWIAAIKDDHLDWPFHLVSTTLFDHPVIKSYNVKQIPTRFLINPEGVIIAVDPDLQQVSKLISEYSSDSNRR